MRVSRFPDLGRKSANCADMSVIPQAKAEFRFSQQRLLLSFPQAAVSSAARGWVDPKQWDDGVTALLLNYAFSGANNWSRKNDTPDSDNQYVNLRPGINIGPWRLRNYTTGPAAAAAASRVTAGIRSTPMRSAILMLCKG